MYSRRLPARAAELPKAGTRARRGRRSAEREAGARARVSQVGDGAVVHKRPAAQAAAAAVAERAAVQQRTAADAAAWLLEGLNGCSLSCGGRVQLCHHLAPQGLYLLHDLGRLRRRRRPPSQAGWYD